MIQTKDLFISYGRRESLGFVGRLHRLLKLQGYDGWFDKVNIPDGDDYALRINNGIESAHNFVYVMAPRSLTSPYCLLEIEYARILGKRVIPVNQMVIFNAPDYELSASDKAVLKTFYETHSILDPEINTAQDVLDRSLALIGRTDWLDGKENLSDSDCNELSNWAQTYENQWIKHDDLNHLEAIELPEFGESIDPIETVVEHIALLLDKQKHYVYQHTKILLYALRWQNNGLATRYLLVGKKRMEAYNWLRTEFIPPKQPPCQVTDLQADYICESRKNAENLMTDLFLCHAVENIEIRNQVAKTLAKQGITCWTHDRDIDKSEEYHAAIIRGIEQADNFVFFISNQSVQSEYCLHELENAEKLNKRIIPILIDNVSEVSIPYSIRDLQYIDFTDNVRMGDFERDLDDILNTIRREQTYFYEHKVLLVRALKWKKENKVHSFLLRGYNLENAQTWLRLNQDRDQFAPTQIHKEFIVAGEATKGQLGADVFISYSRKDSDFSRKLNTALQEAEKTTWFDQESISSGVDFEKEIYKGIDNADNFIFVISPDSIISEYCEREVNYAKSKNKRIITILYRNVSSETMPQTLQAIQWIDFKNISFEKSFRDLVQSIDIDREHANRHTLFQQRAAEWEDHQRSSDFLLNETASSTAEIWLKEAFGIEDENLDDLGEFTPQKQPIPTHLQVEYIQESRLAILKAEAKNRHRRRRLRTLLGISVVSFVISAGLGMNAWHQNDLVRKKSAEIDKAYDSLLKVKTEAEEAQERVAKISGKAHDYQIVIKETELEVHKALRTAQSERDKAQEQLQRHKKLVQSISFSETENLAMVFDHGLWGYINQNGNRVIRPQFSNPRNFYLGYAYVNDAFFINTRGTKFKRQDGLRRTFTAMRTHPKASKLTVLELQSLKIKALSTNIKYLKGLQYLVLYNNELTSLPREIGQLQSLTNLYLSRNKLQTLPKEIGKLKNLTYLNLGMNRIKTLPTELKNLKNLKELDLRGNHSLPKSQIQKLRKALPYCTIKH